MEVRGYGMPCSFHLGRVTPGLMLNHEGLDSLFSLHEGSLVQETP